MSEGNFVRVLKNQDVLALAFGAMVGWGWVVLAGSWVQTAGSWGSMFAFGIGGVVVILIGLTYAELASAMPLTGGEHVYSYRALGMGASFICTWSIILGYVSVVAFEAVALPTVVEELFPNYKVGLMWNVAGWDVAAEQLAQMLNCTGCFSGAGGAGKEGNRHKLDPLRAELASF